MQATVRINYSAYVLHSKLLLRHAVCPCHFLPVCLSVGLFRLYLVVLFDDVCLRDAAMVFKMFEECLFYETAFYVSLGNI